ncbi:MAG: hypothetical protein A2600_06565 [Candidatus Lambdaproteobacteria bacterium RIFOXYD1_FULL_56_27]|uniref:Uncharacterized protein n=1 Tax=Candidatus Lambdaproteobacteria bacterium RIFOXYD2_FULL_56_26 TaxID=1817773 RepID=A0A1F6H0K1_9PROT|nr:MAG: hypothetical protein A2426_05980 [Candidatus Lambdaproteobacteria bacterium RIFOXYC1_FULL_56_13]OGH03869.1 MAG: hypothetical protein A2557_12075 [Candidatus Lambdaproteobacteria bacterium RIFOXYD2_FULL_56_26]OGH08997.1 MAG: hypothetical protein A2600_06565 [Candidatus Lambdaproteobacteria bacterium RIFOXYD1_FULL_56_27]
MLSRFVFFWIHFGFDKSICLPFPTFTGCSASIHETALGFPAWCRRTCKTGQIAESCLGFPRFVLGLAPGFGGGFLPCRFWFLGQRPKTLRFVSHPWDCRPTLDRPRSFLRGETGAVFLRYAKAALWVLVEGT